MSVLEPPFERVNYFNGERLEARDFRAEQNYLIRVRRLLNRSLYSPGIVKGLEVTKHPNDKHKVLVAPGLAFDVAGREIVLLDAATVQVVGVPSTTAGVVFGNFLVVSYYEQRGLPAADACRPAAADCGCELAWSGPTRIRSDVKLEFVDTWPSDASGRMVLAQIELKAGCEVAAVHSGVRKYAVAAKPPKVRPVSIEGEKDIDPANSKVLYFHVSGGFPQSATLVLRGALFSTLYYSELGSHTHVLDVTLADHAAVAPHDHTLPEVMTEDGGVHSHAATSNFDEDDPAENAIYIDGAGANDKDMAQLNFKIKDSPPHKHKVPAGVSGKAGGTAALNHQFLTKAAQDFGCQPPKARTGAALTYVNNLQIFYDDAPITPQVLEQLHGRDATTWPLSSTLGDGTLSHAFVKPGTREIDLTRIVADIGPGDHKLEFKVTAGGGKVHYNLYLE